MISMMKWVEDMPDEFASAEEEEFDREGSADEYDNLDLSDYVSDGDDEIADYKLRDDNYPEADDKKTIPFKIETSFHEMLLDQLGMLILERKRPKNCRAHCRKY